MIESSLPPFPPPLQESARGPGGCGGGGLGLDPTLLHCYLVPTDSALFPIPTLQVVSAKLIVRFDLPDCFGTFFRLMKASVKHIFF